MLHLCYCYQGKREKDIDVVTLISGGKGKTRQVLVKTDECNLAIRCGMKTPHPIRSSCGSTTKFVMIMMMTTKMNVL